MIIDGSRQTNANPPQQLCCYSAGFGGVLFIAAFVGLGFVTPGYSLVRDTISALELNPIGIAQQTNFFVFGVLICMFAVGLRREMQEGFGSLVNSFYSVSWAVWVSSAMPSLFMMGRI